MDDVQRLIDRIEVLEAALVDCTNELDSYGEEMPFTATGIEAHKARVAKFRKVIKGDDADSPEPGPERQP